jgi:hypothetical protein
LEKLRHIKVPVPDYQKQQRFAEIAKRRRQIQRRSAGISQELSVYETAVISAGGDDDLAFDAGSAYIFTKTGSTWTQQQKIYASDGHAGDTFGNF